MAVLVTVVPLIVLHQPVLIDKSRLTRAVFVGRFHDLLQHFFGVAVLLFPEFVIHGYGVICAPQEATTLDGNEVENLGICPNFGGNPRAAARAANQHTLCQVVIGKQRLLPGRHVRPFDGGNFFDCIH